MNKSTDTTNATGLNRARQLWLAGIGAYGMIFETAKDRIIRANSVRNKAFDELVTRGEEIEVMTQDQITLVREGTRSELEARIQRIREAVIQPTTNEDDKDMVLKLKKENASLKRKLKLLSQSEVKTDKAA